MARYNCRQPRRGSAAWIEVLMLYYPTVFVGAPSRNAYASHRVPPLRPHRPDAGVEGTMLASAATALATLWTALMVTHVTEAVTCQRVRLPPRPLGLGLRRRPCGAHGILRFQRSLAAFRLGPVTDGLAAHAEFSHPISRFCGPPPCHFVMAGRLPQNGHGLSVSCARIALDCGGGVIELLPACSSHRHLLWSSRRASCVHRRTGGSR